MAIFLAAVTETAAADYSPEQIQAWARPEARELSTWHAAMHGRNSYVATVDGEPAGFSDIDPQGYIDMMFVAPRYLRLGVARQLLGHVESKARADHLTALTADVSITARPFFERHGFVVEAKQHPVMVGVQLTYYAMKKNLLGN
ncbi:GNAT family N-acetyltransferase [Arthrobacter glacialis]|uniref:GNAT family N-acetyltransferase n=2 Tax=Arthrobacter glacialis TaxID=1664 RepID=A0A2S3ZR82_ARTGL|nr:GNAT family N-acetyltransferase [Arthrobacter glacialis]